MLLLTAPLSFLHSTRSLPHAKPSPSPSPPRPLPFLHPNSRHLRRPNSKVVRGVRFDGPVIETSQVTDAGDGDLVIETCLTRNLTPALTLQQGLERIKEAVEELKLNPPSTSTGILRFQVAVPPCAKALSWFCCQPEQSAVYPLFFISKEAENLSYKSLYVNETRGVFGIGASIYFTPSNCSSIKRIISNESASVIAYGFMDINYDLESSCMKHEAGSYYFFVPQIELHEHEGSSMLAATIGWSESSLCTFEEAVSSYELTLNQVICHICSRTKKFHTMSVISTLRKLNLPADRIVSKVHMNMLLAGGKNILADIMALKQAPSSSQFCVRFSPTTAVANKMLDHASKMCFSVQDCGNINTVWASLIIEECSRLGLMYFCVAPGSRSSPLAVAASTHPLITCIVCYDERSLAFHAVGYGRGSGKPAVVITSSGTAVSNLFPAVVEASQDFVPLLLLTADRPTELQDTGANQAINQVNHFGSFVRFFFSLPAPTDQISARMVLTTLDSAVHWATSSPCGPAHINCAFREPLENSPRKWMLSCLKGLNLWMSNSEPFTKYIQVQQAHVSNDGCGGMSEILNLIKESNKGLLLIGAIHSEDEMWAAFLLAKHLQWPVTADILSGLRLRKFLTSFPEVDNDLLFIDHLDHALLSDSVRNEINIDVIIQIGSRITSKRIAKMLEDCSPCSYIMVDKHPFRHDPSHIVTHRVHNNIFEFADYVLKAEIPHLSKEWTTYLQMLNATVESELSFQICAQHSLTEPQVAYLISEALSAESALFIGNSMAIRDADMYGRGWSQCTSSTAVTNSKPNLTCQMIRVAGNRGASGIDGLLSTAVGFAVGCNKRVVCIIGDVSFLHDTNGLAIVNQRTLRKPMTIIVINNHGGAIFSLLPLADRVEPRILDQYFYTSHNVSIRELCAAHGVMHLHTKTRLDLEDALLESQHGGIDCVIEVESCIDTNASFHSTLRKFACQAADQVITPSSQDPIVDGISLCRVQRMEYSLYRMSLCAPHTMVSADGGATSFYREGFILTLYFEDGSFGFGEVAPLDICKENLLDVEEQLRFLIHMMKGADISCCPPLLRGSFSSWIQSNLGILPCTLFPSVRCGLEMAILNAIATRQGSDLLGILNPQKAGDTSELASTVQICALVDSNGTPAQVAESIATLVEEGFTAVKIKVARCGSPLQDAAVIQEVRNKVGYHIKIRADANRKWTYEEAIQFGSLVKDCDLQYIEEPVRCEEDIIKFCKESGLPVALDETIDSIGEHPLIKLSKYTHSGIVAVDNVLVFLHGFLGTGEDWIAIMKALSGCGRCISIDLPGHGGTKIQNHALKDVLQASGLSVEDVADILGKVIARITPRKVTLVGYSMGARIALYMALRLPEKVKGAIIISGSPGLTDEVARKIRRADDDSRARFLVAYGLKLFLDTWYTGELWNSLREHPHFHQIVADRLHHGDVQSLAKVLSSLSVGRQVPLWEDLKHCRTPLLLIVGEKDKKFKKIAQDMSLVIGSANGKLTGDDGVPNDLCEIVEISDCGHAAHLENPLPVVRALRRFVTKLN
ncbi:protein PHYLLO, chloroplastic isoform X2 [Argentina anserina]|uniref:protein PHYLLO, chloroplastic isoform X2 n=1 Tax=Argentina anserina TaxID=57926 RepID=UPI0021762C18|nr:protein PHYLLO, chloroplastic isoform X2 [Potentilla anserina]